MLWLRPDTELGGKLRGVGAIVEKTKAVG